MGLWQGHVWSIPKDLVIAYVRHAGIPIRVEPFEGAWRADWTAIRCFATCEGGFEVDPDRDRALRRAEEAIDRVLLAIADPPPSPLVLR